MSFDWKKLVGSIAPTIATALGGPLAGAATAAISSAVLGKPDASEDELSTALAAASPDTLAKIKEADNNFKIKMQELGVDLEKARYQDVQNARAMNIARPDNTARNLAYMALIGFFAVLFIELGIAISPDMSIDETTQRTLDITTGVLFAWVLAVKDFYFGSSKGEVHSNQALRRIAEGENPN